MSKVLGRIGWTAPVAVTALVLGACSNGASPTVATAAAPSAVADQQGAASMLVQGMVVDSASRPMASAQVECMGNVVCTPLGAQVIEQDGPDDGVRTNASGGYAMVVKRTAAGDSFMLAATAKGYEPTIRESAFPDATCTSDRAGCALTVDFTLASGDQ